MQLLARINHAPPKREPSNPHCAACTAYSRPLRWHRDELRLSTSSGYSLEATPLDRLLRLRMVIRGHHLSDSTASTKGVPADRRSAGRLRAIHRLTLSFPKQVSLLVPTGKAAIDVELLAPIELPRIAMNAHSTPLC